MARALCLSIMSILLGLQIAAQYEQIDVALLQDRTVNSIMLQAKTGAYTLQVNGKDYILKPEDGLRITKENGLLVAKTLSLSLSSKKPIVLKPREEVSRFRIRSSKVDVAARLYQGQLLVKTNTKGLLLRLTLPLEDYVAGVVQSESGKGRASEYYKLQSIICRTYALANKNKHAHEGFNVCDQTHCQVFKGSCKYNKIQDALEATKGQVAVDSEIEFIDATFHSNCGGETVCSEDVWSKEVSYLRAKHDKYCQNGKHSNWRVKLSKESWLAYLVEKHNFDRTNEALVEAVLNYKPVCRDIYLANIYPEIPLEDVRHDLALKSTWFSVETKGNEVVLEGKGFGHGVGLCQEGAMVMALTDRDFREILHHYFSDVHIVDIDALQFFRDEELSQVMQPSIENE